MFVAIDISRGEAVTGIDIHTEGSSLAPRTESAYRCLFCNEPLTYIPDPDSGPFGYFVHDTDETCLNDGNVSAHHRLGQEVVAKTVFNLLPTGHDVIEIDLERQIGVQSAFVIADVRVTMPVRLAVEVVYLSAGLDLQRRLRMLFAQGYVGMIVVVVNGLMSPRQVDRHLRKVGDIRAGKFDPWSLDLQFGSVVTPDRVNLDSPNWNNVPAYLS